MDIKKQEFASKFKGYSPDDVHAYLETVANEMEQLIKKNADLEQKITMLEDRLSHYTKIESVLQETLLNTQKSAEEIKATAERNAKSILDESRLRATQMISDAKQSLLQIRREIAELISQKNAFIINFRSLLTAQNSLIDMIEKRSEQEDEISLSPKRTDATEEELDRIVQEFEKQLEMKSKNISASASDSGEKDF
jgi:cell division initiation protein